MLLDMLLRYIDLGPEIIAWGKPKILCCYGWSSWWHYFHRF